MLLATAFAVLLLPEQAWAQQNPAPQPALTIEKTDAPDQVTVGDNLTYIITVQNDGPGTAQNVVLTDPLPANTTFISAEVTQGDGTCAEPSAGAGTGTVTCNLGSIVVGDSRTIQLVVRPTASAGGAGAVENTATARGSNTTSASDTERTRVNESPVGIEKDDSPDPADVDESLVYTLQVTDESDSTQNLNVVDELPDTVDFIGASSSQGRCTESNNVVTCRLGDVQADAPATIRIFVEPLEEGTITNTAQVFRQGDPFTPLAQATERTRVESDDAGGPGANPPGNTPPGTNPPGTNPPGTNPPEEEEEGDGSDGGEVVSPDENEVTVIRETTVLRETIPGKNLPETGGTEGGTPTAGLFAGAGVFVLLGALAVRIYRFRNL